VVSRVPGVARLSPRVDGQIEFETSPGQDPRPEVARAVVNAGYSLLEMHPVGLSLEEIFLQLTREEPAPPGMSDEELFEDDEPDDESDDF
jgi:ABC-2 type transport system ATP-binding protein